jgi:hypothetical protein
MVPPHRGGAVLQPRGGVSIYWGSTASPSGAADPVVSTVLGTAGSTADDIGTSDLQIFFVSLPDQTVPKGPQPLNFVDVVS